MFQGSVCFAHTLQFCERIILVVRFIQRGRLGPCTELVSWGVKNRKLKGVTCWHAVKNRFRCWSSVCSLLLVCFPENFAIFWCFMLKMFSVKFSVRQGVNLYGLSVFRVETVNYVSSTVAVECKLWWDLMGIIPMFIHFGKLILQFDPLHPFAEPLPAHDNLHNANAQQVVLARAAAAGSRWRSRFWDQVNRKRIHRPGESSDFRKETIKSTKKLRRQKLCRA